VGKSVTGIRLAAAALLLLAPLLAHSAGLGRLTVTSALGQPLNAEIEIVSLQPGEEDSLTARLATPEAFKQAGMDMSPALIGFRFAIERRGGKPYIRLRSAQAINDPFLDVLIELQWSTGRLVREYTFLLDPPEYKAPAPVAAAPQAAPAAAPRPAPAAAAPRIEARPIVAAPSAPAGKAGSTHEVRKGETLGAIARANMPQGVTLNQMLIALYRANQDAFIRGNINLVRAGRILAIPDRDAITSVDPADANGLVKAQMSEFADYRQKLAGVVAAAPAPAPAREVTGRIAPKPEAPASAEQKDQLRLSKADPAKPGAPASKAAREDDRVARDRALKEQQSRIGDLEKNVTDLQKLVEMKNQQLAELEKKAGAKPAPAAPVAPAKPEPAKPVAEAPKPAPEPAKPVAEAPKPAPEPVKPAVEAPKADAPKAAEPAKAAEAPKAPPAPAKPAADAKKAKAPAKAPPPAEPDLVDEVMSFVTDPVSGGGLIGVLLLLAGYGTWAWRKKKASQSSQFQDSVLGAASGGAAGSVFGAGQSAPGATPAAAAPPDSGISETPSVESPSVGAAESDEVDPIAEADVYMAYGRNAQAEEILKEALAKDGSRVPVHVKLLEIYANQRDVKAFEQSALKVKSLTGSSGPEWDKAMALGHSIDPDNGLYGSGASGAGAEAAAPAAAAPVLDFDIGGGGAEAAPEAAKSDTTAPLDFDLGGGEKTDFAPGGTLVLDSGETKAASSGLDFDLDKTIVGGLNLGAMPKAEAPKAPDPDATVAMDFDLNLDLGGDKPAETKADGGLDIGGLNLDIGGAGGGDAKWQELATKLDLAKAYEEMGDKDGARELLNEVARDGDAAQQAQAKQMLGNLG